MFDVLCNDLLAPDIHRMVLRAPRIAAARRPGQFVIVRLKEGAERIPLTIADADAAAGTIGAIRDVAGPLGKPTEIERFGRVVCVGGGVGTAVLFPIVKALAEAGNEVTTLIGGRSEPYLILRRELSAFSKKVLLTTEDGSAGVKGFVTAALGEILADEGCRPDAVYAVGPAPMMSAVAEQTRPLGIRTIVSLNPIMVDGTGMCGGCRVTVGGQIKFACVDGPEFDGHLVDFDELMQRQQTYEDERCRLEGKIP